MTAGGFLLFSFLLLLYASVANTKVDVRAKEGFPLFPFFLCVLVRASLPVSERSELTAPSSVLIGKFFFFSPLLDGERIAPFLFAQRNEDLL